MNEGRSRGNARSRTWICPTCSRRFARAKQWHSCKPQTIDFHFAGKDPALRRLFERLIRTLRKTGPLRVDAVKTSINLISRHHFGGVIVRRRSLRVGFLARNPIDSDRVVHRQVLGPNRVAHAIVIAGEHDVDPELLRWLTAAQHLQA